MRSSPGRCLSKPEKKPPRNGKDVAILRLEREQVARAVISILRTYREDADISQEEIGNVLGISEDVISKIETLKRPLSVEDAIAWALGTGTDLRDFLDELEFRLRKIYPPKT